MFLRIAAGAAALTALSACGGGGGVASSGSLAPAVAAPSPTPTPTPTPTPVVSLRPNITPASAQPVRSANDSVEYRRNYVSNEFVGALYALDNGWTGRGVTVGVLDNGVNTALAAFDGKISSLSKDFGTETRDGVTTRRDRLGDAQSDHGTAVAAIIAVRRDGEGTMGVAPDASIAVLRTSDYNYTTATETLAHDAEAIDHAAAVGLRPVNRSLTSQGVNPALRAAVGRYGAAGGLLINAAGNSAGDSPVDAVNVDAANRAAWLFVVALDPQVQTAYALADYSNKAGGMADRTVTAPGTNVTTRVDGTVAAFSGTSSATALVSGVAATILSKWPQLSGVQAAQVILATARDIGAPGVDPVFGAGLIDVAAALSPVNPKLSNGTVQSAVAGAVFAAPTAIGMGSIKAALADVTILDRFGRDFSGSLSGLVVRPEDGRGAWLRGRMAQMGGGASRVEVGPFSAGLGYASYPVGPGIVRQAMTSGEIGWEGGRTGLRMSINAAESLQRDVMGLAPFADGILAYAPQAGTSLRVDRVTSAGRIGVAFAGGAVGIARARATTVSFDRGATSLRASWIDERGSVMGVASRGALALGRGARTAVAELHHQVALAGRWAIEGYGSVGVTRLRIDPVSVVTAASLLWGTRAGVQASGPVPGGVLSLGLAQPLTIERGRGTLTFGTGYDQAARALIVGSTSADLASGARRLQLTAGFAGRSLRLGVVQDVGDGGTRALAGYRRAF